jgi:dTDP-4-amino-4,6-dideoxygalactose transaminase
VSEELEKRICELLNVKYCLVTLNGSTAILMALLALGIKPGDEIIVPNRTWISTAHAPMILGAKPVPVDVLPDKPVIDTNKIREKITEKTKAIVPVHLDGRDSNMEEINLIARENNLAVIEDACQSFLSKTKNGEYLGTLSDIGCLSFSITKLFSTAQGGALITNNEQLYNKLKLIRNNGTPSALTPEYNTLGSNFKFNDILASIGMVQFSKPEERIEHVKKIYNKYNEVAKNLNYIKIIPVNLPEEIPMYVEVLCKDREKLVSFLNEKNIHPRLFLPNVNSAPYIERTGDFPNSDNFEKNGLFLPCGPNLELESVNYVINALKEFEKINQNPQTF